MNTAIEREERLLERERELLPDADDNRAVADAAASGNARARELMQTDLALRGWWKERRGRDLTAEEQEAMQSRGVRAQHDFSVSLL
ncbi:MAG: hypothetical protein ACYSYL_20295, partial [Planctomycetota bacterium]